MPTPLPKLDSPEVQRITKEDSDNLSAYKLCLKYEKELAAFKDKLRYVRILGFLLLHAPNQNVRSQVTKSIHLRKDSSNLTDLDLFFELKKYRGRTPKPSEHPSRSFFEAEKDDVKIDITQAPMDHKDAKYHALVRDNWRCLVTGTIDHRAPEHIVQLDPTAVGAYTQCAHIIPEVTFFGVEPKSKHNNKFEYSASILTVLKLFGYDINSFNGKNVHSLTNVLSMTSDVHDAFDRLTLYFEATLEKDCYEVKWFGRQPYPNMREYIDEIYRGADELDVLSADGTSATILDYLLLSLLTPQDVKPQDLNLRLYYEPASLIMI